MKTEKTINKCVECGKDEELCYCCSLCEKCREKEDAIELSSARIVIDLQYKEETGIEFELKEVMRWIEKGFTSGFDEWEEGGYDFEMTSTRGERI